MKNVQRAVLTGGIVWGGCLFLTTLISASNGYARPFLTAFGSVYPGYDISPLGSIVGGVYGFLDAYIGVYIIVWIYQKLGK